MIEIEYCYDEYLLSPMKEKVNLIGNRYMLLGSENDVLGYGAYGTVHLAIDQTNGSKVAIKRVMYSKVVMKEEFKRILREILILKHLRKFPDNIVTMLDVVSTSTGIDIVFELMNCDFHKFLRHNM